MLYRLRGGDTASEIVIAYRDAGYAMSISGKQFSVSRVHQSGSDMEAGLDGSRIHGRVVAAGPRYHVFLDGRHFEVEYDDPLDVEAQHHAGEGSLLAPMPG